MSMINNVLTNRCHNSANHEATLALKTVCSCFAPGLHCLGNTCSRNTNLGNCAKAFCHRNPPSVSSHRLASSNIPPVAALPVTLLCSPPPHPPPATTSADTPCSLAEREKIVRRPHEAAGIAVRWLFQIPVAVPLLFTPLVQLLMTATKGGCRFILRDRLLLFFCLFSEFLACL